MLILQFNEVNFDIVRKYGHRELPYLLRFIDELQEVKTTSERRYENLEPWIQWVSFYTGKPYQDHKVFHLGDYDEISDQDLFFLADKKGKRTGILGSMNHPGLKSACYLPDPWSTNEPSAEADVRGFYEIIRFIVNRNAGLAIPWQLLPKAITVFYGIKLKLKYKLAFSFIGALLRRDRAVLAGCLDVLLLCFAITKYKSKNLDVAAVFLNGVAHIQHHYMLSSSKIVGSNPEWYVQKDKDPLLSCLKVYESAFQALAREKIPAAIITGLSQKPVKTPVIYWRFVDHGQIIQQVCESALSVQPRMSRDFHVYFEGEEQAIAGAQTLENCQVLADGEQQKAFGFIKQIDNAVFATFIYSGLEDDVVLCNGDTHIPLKKKIRFVASKNAEHQQQGWAFFPRDAQFTGQDELAIWDLKDKLLAYLD